MRTMVRRQLLKMAGASVLISAVPSPMDKPSGDDPEVGLFAQMAPVSGEAPPRSRQTTPPGQKSPQQRFEGLLAICNAEYATMTDILQVLNSNGDASASPQFPVNAEPTHR